jgi:hypothetical protein
MSDAWLEELARTQGVDALSDGEVESLLNVARDVAHRVERKVTPLAAFLLGMAVERRISTGASRGEALDDTIAELAGLLPGS